MSVAMLANSLKLPRLHYCCPLDVICMYLDDQVHSHTQPRFDRNEATKNRVLFLPHYPSCTSATRSTSMHLEYDIDPVL